MTAGTAKAERPEDLAMEVIGDRDERTVLLYRLGRAMGISLQGDKEGEEELDLLRHKFRALSSYHLRLLLAKLEQEIRRDDEETTMRTEEKETESMLEGVVKAEGDEEKELAGELEMDEESLGSLEEAVTSEVKEKLAELGLPTDGECVYVMVYCDCECDGTYVLWCVCVRLTSSAEHRSTHSCLVAISE